MSVNAPRSSSFGAAAPASNAGSSAGLAVIQIVLLISFPMLMQSTEGQRGLVALIIATILIALVSKSPSIGIPCTLVYVAIFSGLRRWLIPLFGYAPSDPFVLVTPIIVVLNFVAFLLQRRVPRDTLLARLVLWLICLMGVEALNPQQGGLAVGFGGLLLSTVPILWYYLARDVVTPRRMTQFYQLALVLSVLCTLYGLYQQFVGLLPSEIEYVNITKYSQNISTTSHRVFSTLSGFQEYANLIALGAVLSFAQMMKKNKPAIFVFIFLVVAALLSSSRGIIVSTLASCVVLWAVQGRTMKSWWPRLVVAAIIGVGGSYWSLKQVKDNNVFAGNQSASQLVDHQTQLLDPFQKKFTGGGHVTSQFNGIITGFEHPFGYGTGSVTLAENRFGGDEKFGMSAEGDIGNAFIALGCVGGCIFLYLIYAIYREALMNWHYFRDLNSLSSLAIVVATFLQWLTGGDYIIALMVWFSIGYIDLSSIQRRLATDPPAPLVRDRKSVRRRRGESIERPTHSSVTSTKPA